MDVEELKTRTRGLEEAIADAVSNFNRETGFVVTEFALVYGEVPLAASQGTATVLQNVSALLVVP